MSKFVENWINTRTAIYALAIAAASVSSMQTAQTQTCTQIPQRVTTPSLTAVAPATIPAGWTVTGEGPGGHNWTANGTYMRHWGDNPDPADVLSQQLTNVSGGAVLEFDYQWSNSNFPRWGIDGTQAELSVSFNGVEYVRILTSPIVKSGVQVSPGPTAGASITPLNGATSLRPLPAPPLPNRWITVTVRLPDNINGTGALSFSATGTEPEGKVFGSDDFYLRNVTVVDRTLCLVKQTQNAAGTFNFVTTNLNVTSLVATTPSANGSAAADADGATSGIQPAMISANLVTITESLPATGHRLTSAVCDNGTDATIGGTATAPVVTLSAIDMDVADADNGRMVTCTLTNSRPRIRLQKTLPDGRHAAGDQFALTVAGAQNNTNTSRTATTTGATTAPTEVADFIPANPGATYTLSEAVAGTTALTNYVSSISCSNATTGSTTTLPSGSGTSFSLVTAAADDITCTITNSRRLANLVITKTNTGTANGGLDQAADTVTSGITTTYTLTVSNTGRDAANDAIVRDTPGSGLLANSCSVISATANALAAAPASGNWPSLFTTGVAIPTLSAGGEVVFEVRCMVN